MPKADGQVELLLKVLDQAFDRSAWHGTNMRGSVRGLTPERAYWRPGPERHNVWELVVHIAYWKYIGWRRMTGTKRGSFPLKGSNWFKSPESPDPKAWKAVVSLMDDMHRLFRDTVAKLPPSQLYVRPATSKVDNARLIYGIASHDLYHAGQVQLLKRLQKR